MFLYSFLVFAGILVGSWALTEWVVDGTHKFTVFISVLALVGGLAGIANSIAERENLCESKGGVMIKDVCMKGEVIKL